MPASNSIVWSEEEARYLKALLSFDSVTNGTGPTKPKVAKEEEKRPPPIAEFKILVVGAKGCGKTSILEQIPSEETHSHDDAGSDHKRRSSTSPLHPVGGATAYYEDEHEELEPEREHRVTLDGLPYAARTVEFRSRHLLSDPHLLRALDCTDAAVVVYDVTSRASLRIAQSIVELVRDSVGLGFHPADSGYGVVLVGNKADCAATARQVPWAEGAAIAHGRFQHLLNKRTRRSKGTAAEDDGEGDHDQEGEKEADVKGEGDEKAAVPLPFLFLETSATATTRSTGGPGPGDEDSIAANIDKILPHLCRETLRIRLVKQQRWEAFLREAAAGKEAEESAKRAQAEANKPLPLWKLLLCPWRTFARRGRAAEEETPYL